MPMYHITSKKQLDELLAKSPHLIIIKFGSVRCGPCRMMEPVLKAVSEKYADVLILDVDIDKLPDIASIYKVSGIPSFVFIKQRRVVATYTGAMQQGALEKLINTHK